MRMGRRCVALAALSLIASVQCFSPSPLSISSQGKHNEEETTRRRFLVGTIFAGALLSSCPSFAAPPIAIIAEELGYFPVTNRYGETVYVPKRIQRPSSNQAIELAKHLQQVSTYSYEE